jgi:hypothetical protein
LSLAEGGVHGVGPNENCDMTFVTGRWGKSERALDPPVSLLSWLVRHPEAWVSPADSPERERLASGDPGAVRDALDSIQSQLPARHWSILEGRSYPDAFIETPDSLIVIEGKRTETGVTKNTKWLSGRHQMWRHIDAAWEMRGRRQVFGLLMVEGSAEAVPGHWLEETRATEADAVLESSFPHRSANEVAELRRCFLGGTTGQKVCHEFKFDPASLPDTTEEAGT